MRLGSIGEELLNSAEGNDSLVQFGTFAVVAPEPGTISFILFGFFFVMLGIVLALSLQKRSGHQLHRTS